MTESWIHEHALPIPAAPARIFEALTTTGHLERWFAERAQVEPVVGGAFRFWGRHTVGTPREREATGTVTVFEPDARLGFDWMVCGVPSTVTITLTPEQTDHGPVTRVAVRHELRDALPQPRPKELIDDWWRFTLGNLMTHTTGRGEVLRPDFADPRPEIRLSMFVDAPREAVFRALTEPDALREWMGAPAPVVELRVGGRYELGWTYQVDGRDVSGGPMRILDLVPNERLVVNWPDWRGDVAVPTQSITWLLGSEGTGTRVTLIHAGFSRTVDFSDYPFGWGHFMAELARVARQRAQHP
jgi:uncharacterized protein YndB with AHSA1/START domain